MGVMDSAPRTAPLLHCTAAGGKRHLPKNLRESKEEEEEEEEEV